MSKVLNTDAIEERFFVHGRMEILHALNDLIHRHEAVTIHYPTANGSLASLDIYLLEARDQQLVFDAGDDTAAHLRLLAATDCAFVAHPDGIRLQFSARAVQRTQWGDSSAFAVPLPERLARLQRQEFFRTQIPATKGMQAQLTADDEAGLGSWPVHDLSAGGIGITVKHASDLAFAARIARVSFKLPTGPVECAVALRHATGLPEEDGQVRYRIGLGFVGLALEARASIQRFITQTEQERRQSNEEARNT